MCVCVCVCVCVCGWVVGHTESKCLPAVLLHTVGTSRKVSNEPPSGSPTAQVLPRQREQLALFAWWSCYTNSLVRKLSPSLSVLHDEFGVYAVHTCCTSQRPSCICMHGPWNAALQQPPSRLGHPPPPYTHTHTHTRAARSHTRGWGGVGGED